MSVTPAPASRPRTVVLTFWCWVAGAVLVAALGLYMVTTSLPVILFYRLAGALLIVVGVAQGYLAGRARNGKIRFAAAGVGLALASVVLLVLLLFLNMLFFWQVVVASVIMILLITGSAMSQRSTSQHWYESQGAP